MRKLSDLLGQIAHAPFRRSDRFLERHRHGEWSVRTYSQACLRNVGIKGPLAKYLFLVEPWI
jgi:hypothetical protein